METLASPGRATTAHHSRRELQRWARGNMADYKIPTRIHEVGELPLTPTGKTDRLALRESVEAPPGG